MSANPQSFHPHALAEALAPWRGAPMFLIAYSGGRDSHALLHAAADLGLPLRAIHVDHALQRESANWARHCRRVCEALGVSLEVRRVAVDPRGQGIEAAARAARYGVFEELLEAGECLVTAHHADDQAETRLLRVLRGTGIDGLAGMPAERPLGRGRLIRPLLTFSRAAITAYALEQGLTWIDDPSNRSDAFDRNFLRESVLPLLEERWPDVPSRLARLGGHAGDAVRLLDRYAREDLNRAGAPRPEVEALRRLEPLRRAAAIRLWTRDAGLRPPPEARLRQGLEDLLSARPDAEPLLAWTDGQIRRFAGRLHLLPPALPQAPAGSAFWDGRESLRFPGLGILEPGAGRGGLDPGVFTRATVSVRFRRGGESLRLGGARRSLKKLLQQWGVPPWERERLPLIYVGEELAAVPGHAVADTCRSRQDGVVPVWRPRWTEPL